MEVTQPFLFPDNYRITGTRDELYSMYLAIGEILSSDGLANYVLASDGLQGEIPNPVGHSQIQLVMRAKID